MDQQVEKFIEQKRAALEAAGKPIRDDDLYYKLAIIVRKDLEMNHGKVIAQAIHAGCDAYEHMTPEIKQNWNQSGQRTVALKINGLEALLDLQARCQAAGLQTYIMRDAGLTQVEPGSVTCMAVGPDTSEKIDLVLRHLKLY